jgi:hypothetical protein
MHVASVHRQRGFELERYAASATEDDSVDLATFETVRQSFRVLPKPA